MLPLSSGTCTFVFWYIFPLPSGSCYLCLLGRRQFFILAACTPVFAALSVVCSGAVLFGFPRNDTNLFVSYSLVSIRDGNRCVRNRWHGQKKPTKWKNRPDSSPFCYYIPPKGCFFNPQAEKIKKKLFFFVSGVSKRGLRSFVFLNFAPNHPVFLTLPSRKPHHVFRKFAPLPYYRTDL